LGDCSNFVPRMRTVRGPKIRDRLRTSWCSVCRWKWCTITLLGNGAIVTSFSNCIGPWSSGIKTSCNLSVDVTDKSSVSTLRHISHHVVQLECCFAQCTWNESIMGMAASFHSCCLETIHTVPTDIVFRILTPYGLLCGYRYFGRICRLSLYGRKPVTLA
jgi:hypothetical protein